MKCDRSKSVMFLQINLIRERGLTPARDQRGCSPPLETPFNCSRLKRRGLLRITFGALLLGLCIDLFMGGVAFPQTSFFQGKTVTILESSAPGGVGSMRTKAVVPFLQKYIPGNPTIVMQYMDGGGGRKAANHLYQSVRPDGLTIGRMSTPFVMQPMLGESGILYDIDKVSYLGTSYSGGYHIFISRREAGLDNLEKLRAASGTRIGSQSVGHLIYISGRLFAYLMGLKQPRFVTGYSSPELDVAIEQGEIDARSTVADSLLHEKPEWVDKSLMDFHSLIEIPKGRKHSHPRFAKLPDIETLPGRRWTGNLFGYTGPSWAAVTRLSCLPARLKTGCRSCRKRRARPIETSSFSRSIQSSPA